MSESTLKDRAASFDDLVDTQCSSGNWNYDPYMHGMANGMILAQAMMRGEEPEYLTAPDEWLSDRDVVATIESECIETPLI